MDGVEKQQLYGLDAKFGAEPPKRDSNSLKKAAVLANPLNLCTNSSVKFSDSIVLAVRGNCSYTDKAKVAESGGAAGLLVINENEELPQMTCGDNDTSLEINILALMITKSAGESITKPLASGGRVEVLLYSPKKVIVDSSVIFLWMMALGTIVISSLWGGADACTDQDPFHSEINGEQAEEETVELKTSAAIGFLVSASTILVLLYFFLNKISVWLIIVLFCLGGSAGVHTCLVGLISRLSKVGQGTVDLPVFGEATIVEIVLCPFCVAFAVFWAAHQKASYAWLFQDILGMGLMISGLRVVKLPNIKVATALLGCAFFYDIFWVFISPYIFKKSVMVEVARGKDTGGYSMPMVLTIPRLFDPWDGTSIVGFGDVMMPGLLVAFSYRFDKLTKKGNLNGYFLWLLVGYTVGFCFTYLSLYLMKGQGQPALLYLVPCTLGLIIILGCVRREMKDLWVGVEEPKDAAIYDEEA